MKYLLLLLFLLPLPVNSQNTQDDPNKIFSLEEVDRPPQFPGCESNIKNCNDQQIINFLIEKMEPELLSGLSAEDSRVFIKIIIDREGNVRRPMVQSKVDELKVRAMQLLKELPAFKPATRNGEAVNAIFSIRAQLLNPSPEDKNLNSKAIAKACVQAEDAESCTINWLMNNFLDSFYDLNIKTGGKTLVTEVYFDIDSSGKVTAVRVEGENRKMKKAITDWAGKLPDFLPATENGENVESTLYYPISLSSTR